MEIMARKTFKFRLYPSRQQQEKLTATLEVCRELYNAALQERIGAWKNRTPVGVFDQINQLPDIKQIRPDVAGVFSQVLQDTLRRLGDLQSVLLSCAAGTESGIPEIQRTLSIPQLHLPPEWVRTERQVAAI
jgi:putative transposase